VVKLVDWIFLPGFVFLLVYKGVPLLLQWGEAKDKEFVGDTQERQESVDPSPSRVDAHVASNLLLLERQRSANSARPKLTAFLLGIFLLVLACVALYIVPLVLFEENYFTQLGVTRTSTAQEMKRAYRTMSLKYHPDKAPESQKDEMQAKFENLKKMYETLRSAPSRLVYEQHDKSGLKCFHDRVCSSQDDPYWTHNAGWTIAYWGITTVCILFAGTMKSVRPEVQWASGVLYPIAAAAELGLRGMHKLDFTVWPFDGYTPYEKAMSIRYCFPLFLLLVAAMAHLRPQSKSSMEEPGTKWYLSALSAGLDKLQTQMDTRAELLGK